MHSTIKLLVKADNIDDAMGYADDFMYNEVDKLCNYYDILENLVKKYETLDMEELQIKESEYYNQAKEAFKIAVSLFEHILKPDTFFDFSEKLEAASNLFNQKLTSDSEYYNITFNSYHVPLFSEATTWYIVPVNYHS
jgi:hypothetical protein